MLVALLLCKHDSLLNQPARVLPFFLSWCGVGLVEWFQGRSCFSSEAASLCLDPESYRYDVDTYMYFMVWEDTIRHLSIFPVIGISYGALGRTQRHTHRDPPHKIVPWTLVRHSTRWPWRSRSTAVSVRIYSRRAPLHLVCPIICLWLAHCSGLG